IKPPDAQIPTSTGFGCSPTGIPKKKELRDLIITRFRIDRVTESPSKIEHALQAGYTVLSPILVKYCICTLTFIFKALGLLNRCRQADTASLRQVDSLLAETKSLQEKHWRQDRVSREGLTINKRSSKQTTTTNIEKKAPIDRPPHFINHSVLARPYPHVSGRRLIPQFVSVRGLPYLRIVKPMPKTLAMILNRKLAARWKKILHRDRMDTELLFALDEDRWDILTCETEAQTQTWGDTVLTSLSELQFTINQRDRASYELGQRMWKVVLDEKALAKKEAEENDRQVPPNKN
ncbi:hypothetical protein FQN57_000420, partial [Myotisia sp. PD_48]